MPRDAKDKTPKPKTALERKSIELTDHIFRKLCNEKVFPKRSRWLFSGKIADLCNDYMNCVDLANETRVVTQGERDKRHSSGDGIIRAMDKFYTELFGEKPIYKRKRRYLHGDHQGCKNSPAGRMQEEREADGGKCAAQG